MINTSKVEFELTIKKYMDKNGDYMYPPVGKPDYEIYETLNFKSLSATECLRKLIDYLRDY